MRKLLLSVCLTAATCVNAQTLNLINVPEDEGGAMIMDISNNGKYLGGTTTMGMGAILIDWQNDKRVIVDPVDEEGAEIRNVSNNGIGIGFNGPGITLDMNGNMTNIEEPTEEQHVLGEGISDDGKIMVGSLSSGWIYDACYWENGKRTMLPVPTSEEMGYEISGSSARKISSDGSVILGYIVDDLSTFPAVIWKRTGDTYQLDNICKGRFAPSIWNNELGDYEPREEPYPLFQFAALSANGKYAALTLARNVTVYDEEWDMTYTDFSESRIGIYNVETGEIQEIIVDGSTGIEEGTSLTPTAIANDGTVIGYGGDGFRSPRNGFILKAGEKQPVLLSEMYPTIEKFVEFDALAFHTPTSITEDGKYIAGFGMGLTEIEEDGEMVEAAIFQSYVLDLTNDPTAISSVSTTAKKAAEYFTADGRKVSAPVKGINIIKTANGDTKKVFIK